MKKKLCTLLIGAMLVTTLFAGCGQGDDTSNLPSETTDATDKTDSPSQSETNSETDNTQDGSGLTEEVSQEYPTQDMKFTLVKEWAPLQGGIKQIVPTSCGCFYSGLTSVEMHRDFGDCWNSNYAVYVEDTVYTLYKNSYELYQLNKDETIIGSDGSRFITCDVSGNYRYYATSQSFTVDTEIKYGENEAKKITADYHKMVADEVDGIKGSPIAVFTEKDAFLSAFENELWYTEQNNAGRLGYWSSSNSSKDSFEFKYITVKEVHPFLGWGMWIITEDNTLTFFSHWREIIINSSIDGNGMVAAQLSIVDSARCLTDNVKHLWSVVDTLTIAIADVKDDKNLFIYDVSELPELLSLPAPFKIALPTGYTTDDVLKVFSVNDNKTFIVELKNHQFYFYTTMDLAKYDGSTSISVKPVEDLNKYSEHISQTWYNPDTDKLYVLFDNGYLYSYEW